MKPTVYITAKYKSVTVMGFKVRGCRKHANTKQGWFLYFDEKPNSNEINFPMENTIQDQTSEAPKHTIK